MKFIGKWLIIVIGGCYQDSENRLKASVEYENEDIQRLGAVVTNNGYSDRSSVDIGASVKSMWFRLSRRESDFCIENSTDGVRFRQRQEARSKRQEKMPEF